METKRLGEDSFFPGMCQFFGARHGLSVAHWQPSERPQGRGGHCPGVTDTPNAAKCLERLGTGRGAELTPPCSPSARAHRLLRGISAPGSVPAKIWELAGRSSNAPALWKVLV